MARSPNCTGAPWFRGRVDVTITYPDPYEPPLLDPPEALPTSEPASPQIEITITSAMLPVWSPFELEHTKIAMPFAGGKNTSGSTITLYYRILKNGENVATGSQSNILANQVYTFQSCAWLPIKVGDVVSCKLWASATGVDWNFKALAVFATRVGPPNVAVTDMVYELVSKPVLSSGSAGGTGMFYPQHDDLNLPYITAGKTYRLLMLGAQYRACRIQQGDVSLSSIVVGASGRMYARHPVPSRISYTPLNLRV